MIIYIVIYSIISAFFNYQIIESKNWHTSQAALRVFTFAGISLLHGYYIDILLLLSIYWIVFDLTLNLFRGLPVYYVGKTAWLDKHLGYYIYLFKILLIIIIFVL